MKTQIKFTEANIQSLEQSQGKPNYILRDAGCAGLCLRVGLLGKKYFFEKKLNGKTVQLNIGMAGRAGLRLVDAQTIAKNYAAMIANGIDPRGERRRNIEQEARERDACNLKQADERAQQVLLVDLWLEYVEAKKNDTTGKRPRPWSSSHLRDHFKISGLGGVDVDRGLNIKPSNVGLLAPLLNMTLGSLTAEAIEAWIIAENQTRATQAALGFSLFGAFLRWVKLRIHPQMDAEALLSLAKTRQIKASEKNQDTLSMGELAPWFKAVQSQNNQTSSVYLQVLLLIGARPQEETAKMKWADVDTSRKEIRLHDKVDGTRFIPLHPYVEQLIFSLTRKGEYIFHGVGQAGHITRPSKAHTAVIEQAGVRPVTLHGFRRTFKNAGRMAGVLQIYVDKAQGHRPKSVSEANYSMITVDELRAPYSKVVDFILKNAGLEQDYRPRVGHLSIMA